MKFFLSVRLSVKHVHCDKMKETCALILIPHERTFIIIFRHEEWLVEGNPLYLKFWAKLTPFEENADFQLIFARSASAVTPSEKSSVNTNRKSTTHFSFNEPKINFVRCP